MNTVMLYISLTVIAWLAVWQLLRIIYLLLKPKFLSPEWFGTPKTKAMLFAYYVVTLYFLITVIIDKFKEI